MADGADGPGPAAAGTASKATAKFARNHPDACEMTAAGKVRFTLTGMEFPPSATSELLQNYLSGKAMRRAAVAKRNQEYDFSAHAPFVVPHKVRDKGKFMWCVLTERTLPRDGDVLKAHVSGRRFKAALRKVQAAEAEEERIKARRIEKTARRKAWDAAERKGKRGGDGGKEGADAGEGVNGGGDVDDEAMDSAKDVSADGSDDDAAAEDGGEAVGGDGEEAEEDAFWTRGRAAGKPKSKSSRAASTARRAAAERASEDEEDDEWGSLPTAGAAGAPQGKGRGVRGKGARGADKSKAAAGKPDKPGKLAKGRPGGADVGAKRRRDKASAVPKKSRRPSSRVRQAAAAAV